MFGAKNNYAMNRSVAFSVSKMLEKGATLVSNLDQSNKAMGERIENAIADMVNKDEDVSLLTRRIAQKFDIKSDIAVVPKVNDTTLMIESYSLVGVNSKNEYVPIITAANADTLMNTLTELILTKDEGKLKDFAKKAVDALK